MQHVSSSQPAPTLTYHELVARSRDASRRFHTNIVGDSDGYLIASTWSLEKVNEFRSLGLQYSPSSKSWYALDRRPEGRRSRHARSPDAGPPDPHFQRWPRSLDDLLDGEGLSAMDETYQTVNLYEAAYIMAQGYAITIVTLSPTKKSFHFPPEAQIATAGFMRNAPIGARTYAAALRDLKSLIGGRA